MKLETTTFEGPDYTGPVTVDVFGDFEDGRLIIDEVRNAETGEYLELSDNERDSLAQTMRDNREDADTTRRMALMER